MQGSLIPSTRKPIDGVMYRSGHMTELGVRLFSNVSRYRGNSVRLSNMFNAMPSVELSAATFVSSRLTEAARSPTIIKTLTSVMADTVFVFG